MDDYFKKFQKECKLRPRCVLRFVTPEDEEEEDDEEEDQEGEDKTEVKNDDEKVDKNHDNKTDPILQPLWFSGSDMVSDIPKCKHCGSERSFECQVMPSLIALQKTHHEFGTVLVWSCQGNCRTRVVEGKDGNGTESKGKDAKRKEIRYLEEYVVVQREPDRSGNAM